MIKLVQIEAKYSKDYIELLNEFKVNNSELVPDILRLECNNEMDFIKILNEINNRKSGNHSNLDWYEKGYYYLAINEDEKVVGVGCIRYNLTQLGYDMWGNIAYGIRPSERKKGYATDLARKLVEKCKELNMTEVILCHYIDNIISPKVFRKINATYSNNMISIYSGKEIKRYVIRLESNYE